MTKQLLVPTPEAWTTFTSSSEDPSCMYLGGFAVCAEVTEFTPQAVSDSNPIWLVYGWNGEHYLYGIVRNEGLDIGQTCYDSEKVLSSEGAQQAIDAANEFQGGEADWISDIGTGHGSSYGSSGILEKVALDDHATAQKTLIAYVEKLWIREETMLKSLL